jgi:hypothetical protein
MVTTARTPTAAARSTIARTSSALRAPQASRWVCASTNGLNGSGAGGAGRVLLTATQ